MVALSFRIIWKKLIDCEFFSMLLKMPSVVSQCMYADLKTKSDICSSITKGVRFWNYMVYISLYVVQVVDK
jgi:hypothetical protein